MKTLLSLSGVQIRIRRITSIESLWVISTMSNQNHPDPPTRNPLDVPSIRLAGIEKRLLGALIDLLVTVFSVVPGFALVIADLFQMDGQYKMGTLSFTGIALMVSAMLVLLLVQLYLAATRSQSIGKFLVKTQMLDSETRQPAGFFKTVILRIFICGLIRLIPIIGWVYLVVDFCFLFRSDHRCIHDMIAGTVVVDVG